MEDSVESEEDSDDEEMEVDRIYWMEDEEVFAPVSGMRFDPSTKIYMG